VDGLACPLHRPTICSRQMRGHGFLLGIVLSHHVAVGGGALLWDAKPSDLDICGGIDHLDTCVIEFYTEHIAFTMICLPYVEIITVCMHVSLVVLPFHTVMEWIPALECTLSGARGLLQPRPISSVVSATIPKCPDAGYGYLVAEAPGGVTSYPGPSRVGIGEGLDR
jgi:hypothetical protein